MIRTLGAALFFAMAYCTGAHAVPIELTYTGVVSASTLTGANVDDLITFSVFADNHGSSLYSQTWDWDDITSAEIQAGSYTGTVSSPDHGVFGTGFGTDATGQLSLLDFGSSGTGTDTVRGLTSFIFFMDGKNYIWFALDGQISAYFPPDLTNTRITLLTATTPIPAALLLFATALGVLAFFAMQRKTAELSLQ